MEWVFLKYPALKSHRMSSYPYINPKIKNTTLLPYALFENIVQVHGVVVFPLLKDTSEIFYFVHQTIPNDHTKWEYIQGVEHNEDGPPPDNDEFVNYPDEMRSNSCIQVPLCNHQPKNIQQRWEKYVEEWNGIVNNNFAEGMESACMLKVPKVLFNSTNLPPTEQYLYCGYNFIPDLVQIEEVAPSFDEKVEYSGFIGKISFIDTFGGLNEDTKQQYTSYKQECFAFDKISPLDYSQENDTV
eukprot:15364515-Ditylum_brightwellii.AAC.1